MIRRLLLLSCCVYCFTVANSQQAKGKQYRFQSINSLALLNGDNSVTGGLQTVNGFAKGKYFIGAGTGLDYYSYRSVPVFADFRYQFGQKVNKIFLYGDAGVNCSWVQDEFHEIPTAWNGERTNNFNNGISR